ncbi:hypothetical protein NDU88_000398 [Pleurodeles waltl]|uniref:Uncharacterized protein n=1 Tax=Pleurodeles waltl TaxID=8319 RepID=A0AAV7VTC8_PLEWA|nr:hypothetical protein NDU88_000398 [Pleurodeles waltl]
MWNQKCCTTGSLKGAQTVAGYGVGKAFSKQCRLCHMQAATGNKKAQYLANSCCVLGRVAGSFLEDPGKHGPSLLRELHSNSPAVGAPNSDGRGASRLRGSVEQRSVVGDSRKRYSDDGSGQQQHVAAGATKGGMPPGTKDQWCGGHRLGAARQQVDAAATTAAGPKMGQTGSTARWREQMAADQDAVWQGCRGTGAGRQARGDTPSLSMYSGCCVE